MGFGFTDTHTRTRTTSGENATEEFGLFNKVIIIKPFGKTFLAMRSVQIGEQRGAKECGVKREVGMGVSEELKTPGFGGKGEKRVLRKLDSPGVCGEKVRRGRGSFQDKRTNFWLKSEKAVPEEPSNSVCLGGQNQEGPQDTPNSGI